MIRDVASGKTGGIGPVRYVESGKTVNIPVGYVVEGGKTVLVYGETSGGHTPTGNPAYLYNRGMMSSFIGGFSYEGNSQITVTEEADHFAIRCPAGVALSGTINSKHLMDLSAYSTLYVEYEYVNGSTGATITSAGDVYYMRAVDVEGAGSNVLLTLANTSASVGKLAASQRVQFMPGFGAVMSAEYDVILKIYSLRVEK